jgi:tol-pal system protein YbgF
MDLYRNPDFVELSGRVDRVETHLGLAPGMEQEVVYTDMGLPPPAEPMPNNAGLRPGPVRPPLRDQEVEKVYNEAMTLYKKGQYAQAGDLFQQVAEQAPGHPLAPNAMYWLGESFYSQGMYQQALDQFQQVTSTFPDSPKAPDAMLKTAYSYSKLGNGPAGMQQLQALLQRYPNSTAAEKVRAGRTAFKRQRWYWY